MTDSPEQPPAGAPPKTSGPALLQRIEAIADRGDAVRILRDLGLSRKESQAFVSKVKAALQPPPLPPEETDVLTLMRRHVTKLQELLPST